MSTIKLDQFNAMLAGDIDAIEDLPDFINPVTGGYTILSTKAEIAERESKDKDTGAAVKDGVIKLQFSVVACLEATPTEAQQEAVNNVYGASFYGDFGLKQFKKLFSPVIKELGFTGEGAMLRFIDAMNNGVEFNAMFQHRYGDEKIVNGEKQPAQRFSDIKAIVLSGTPAQA